MTISDDGRWGASMTEAAAQAVAPADIDQAAIVLGCTSAGTTGLRGPYLTAASIASALGYGDTCDIAGQACEQRQEGGATQAPIPVAVYKIPVTTQGAYGEIDVTGVTGTSLPTVDAGHPFGTYRAAIQISTGGDLGADDITYTWSLDETPTLSNPLKLLAGEYEIAIPNSGCGFVIEPPPAQVTALITYANDIRTKALAHFTYTTSSVHGSADTTSDDGVHAAATDLPTVVLVLTTAYDALALHFARGTTVHATADVTTSLTAALAAKTAVLASGTAQNAITLALLLETALEAHEALLTAHGAADTVNVVTATHPTRGTLAAGDMFFVRTTGPLPSTADVDAAFVAIASATKYFGVIAIGWPLTVAMAAHVTTGLNAIRARNKFAWALAATAIPSSAQTEEQWKDAISAAWPIGTFDDDRIVLWSSFGRVTDAATTRIYLRDMFAQAVADTLRAPIGAAPRCPDDGVAPNVKVWVDGVQVGHDEGARGSVTGLASRTLGNRFWTTENSADPILGDAVQFTVPWTLAGATKSVKTMWVRRIANSVERAAITPAIASGGMDLPYTAPDPAVPGDVYRLTPEGVTMLHAVLYNGITTSPAASLLQNADDADVETGLVVVNPVVTFTPGALLGVEYTINMRVFGKLYKLAGTLKIKE